MFNIVCVSHRTKDPKYNFNFTLNNRGGIMLLKCRLLSKRDHNDGNSRDAPAAKSTSNYAFLDSKYGNKFNHFKPVCQKDLIVTIWI